MELIFDQRGNLQPYEKVKLNLDEFEVFFIDQFPDNDQRKQIVDAYTIRQYPKGHEKYMLYHSDWVYWYNWFSRTKKNRAKKKYPSLPDRKHL